MKMKGAVLVCCILKALSVVCQDTPQDDTTMPNRSQKLPQTPSPSAQPLTTPSPTSTSTTTSQMLPQTPEPTAQPASTESSSTTILTSGSASLPDSTTTTPPPLPSTPPTSPPPPPTTTTTTPPPLPPTPPTSPPTTTTTTPPPLPPTPPTSPPLTPTTTTPKPRVNQTDCNYTSGSNNQTTTSLGCVCPADFIPLENRTCVKESDLMPMNIRVSATETKLNVSWTYKTMSPPLIIVSKVTTNTSGNSSRTTETNMTFYSQSATVPGQKLSITITPIVSGYQIPSSAVTKDATFIPAKPGALMIPPDGFDAPNTTLRWNISLGFVDGYRIRVTPLCPVGAPSIELMSNMSNVFLTGLKHGREYSLVITAVSLGVTSATSTFQKIITNDLVPYPPNNVTIIPPIGRSSVQLVINSDNDPECSTIYYQATILIRIYDDQEFTEYAKANISRNQKDQVINNLDPGAMYNVTIVSKNRQFSSAENITLTFRTAEAAPGIVKNFTSEIKNTSVKVFFDRPSEPNGVITGYIITITAQTCRVIVKSLTANFNCSSVQSLKFQGQNRTYGDCSCTTVYYDGSLKFDVQDLQPYTTYKLTIQSHNSVGASRPLSDNITTSIGAPLIPDEVNITDIRSNEVTIHWTYSRLTGPTIFSVKIIDGIFQRQKEQTCFQHQSSIITSCKVLGLKAYWRYSFIVIAKTEVASRQSVTTRIITTKQSKPGPVRYLVQERNAGDDCTEDLYGVKWVEPSLESRNGRIIKYRITSTLPDYRWMKKTATASNGYEDTNEQYIHLFAKAGSKRQIFNVSVVSVINRSLRSDPRRVTINIPICSPGLSSGMTAFVVIVVLLCIGLIAILLVWSYKRGICSGVTKRRPLSLVRVTTRSSRQIKSNRPFVLENVKQLVDRLKKDSGRLLLLEWDDLNSLTPEYPTEVALQNPSKNRYKDILPYDRTRVKLYGDENDYINANYIPGFKFEREYIACQGPLPSTVVDFWQMVWEQDVPIIVMLTRCNEGSTVKCEQYWPEDINEPETYGRVEVTRTLEEKRDQYDYSEFKLTLADHEKRIKHFHFLEWPDFGAELDYNVFLDFLFKVKGEIHDDLIGPIVVHCSAGVGRTGTYLAVDYLTEFLRTHRLSQECDIFQLVLKMRNHRQRMVQAKEQYLFIYQCLSELVKRTTTAEDHSHDGLQMPSEEEYSEQLFGASNGSIETCHPEDKLMIEENNDDHVAVGYENPSMTTEL